MKKLILFALMLAVAVPMTSCRRAAEKARENIRIEAVEKVERHGLTGAEVVLRIANGTGYKLSLENAQADIYYGQSYTGSIILCEPVEIARKTTASISSTWRLKISNPLTAYVLIQKLADNDISQISVSFAAEGRGGPAPVTISRERMPLSDFLSTFGVSLQDIKNYIK